MWPGKVTCTRDRTRLLPTSPALLPPLLVAVIVSSFVHRHGLRLNHRYLRCSTFFLSFSSPIVPPSTAFLTLFSSFSLGFFPHLIPPPPSPGSSLFGNGSSDPPSASLRFVSTVCLSLFIFFVSIEHHPSSLPAPPPSPTTPPQPPSPPLCLSLSPLSQPSITVTSLPCPPLSSTTIAALRPSTRVTKTERRCRPPCSLFTLPLSPPFLLSPFFPPPIVRCQHCRCRPPSPPLFLPSSSSSVGAGLHR